MRLTLHQLGVLAEILRDAARRQEAWINSMHTTPEERAAARDKLATIHSIQGADVEVEVG